MQSGRSSLVLKGLYLRSPNLVDMAAVVVYLAIFAPVLALCRPRAREIARKMGPKWASMLGYAYGATIMPLFTAANNGTLSQYALTSVWSTKWLVFPFMLTFGLAAGWGIWKLQESSKPLEPRW